MLESIESPTQELVAQKQAKSCKHCATPLRGNQDQFCCNGCAFVYSTLNSLGLSKYYNLRDLDVLNKADRVTPGRSFAYLTDPQFQAKAVKVLSPQSSSIKFFLPTIHCAACIWLLEKLPFVLNGVTQARVSFRTATIEVVYNPKVIELSEIARTLNAVGYPPIPATHDQMELERSREEKSLLKRIGVAAVCAANTMMIADSLFQAGSTGIEEPYLTLLTWACAIISLPAVLYSALPFYRAAFGSIVLGCLHLDLPISIAIIASYIAGVMHTIAGDTYVYFDSITSLIFLLLIARYAQQRSVHRARASTATTMDLFPANVRVLENGEYVLKPLRELGSGAIVEVQSGERFPADGVITSGSTTIEDSFLTGESLPKMVEQNGRVLGGSINLESTVKFQVEALGETSRLGQVIRKLEESHARPAQSEILAQRLTTNFIAITLSVAVAATLFWWWRDSSQIFDIVISFLVVTCPCALGLAIPTVITVALARANKRGFYVQNADALQLIANAKNYYFDKTGTLTEASLEIVDREISSELECLAGELAKNAGAHPVAQALTAQIDSNQKHLSDYRRVASRGVQALDSTGRSLSLGSLKWAIERKISVSAPFQTKFKQWEEKCFSISVLERDGEVIGAYALSDRVRSSAKEVVKYLQAHNKKVFILSGDSNQVVQTVASQLGISSSQAFGELYPEDKAALIERDPELNAMIGDGLNDALAMRKCGVGIGLSGGLEATLECADIFISNGDLRGFLELLKGCEKVQKVINRNVAYSVVYNLIGAAFALSGHLTPLLAAIMMPISSFTVIVSSTAARYFERK